MKHLIVCCDGTWNTPEQEENNIPAPTNVVRFYNALAKSDADGGGNPQLAYYHTGVGTEGGFLARTAGGAIGEGLDKNIKSGYAWLARNYEPGDRIHLFGFSRGAYTARSLGGLIGRCGLPRTGDLTSKETWKRVDRAFDKGYRESKLFDTWRSAEWAWFAPGTVPIALIGVWDTVGALGVPDEFGILNLFDDPTRWEFYDTRLGKHVEKARQAVALDEQRASFAPTLWTDDEGNTLNDGVRVKQLWFAGVHCDVGGGYGATGLSDVALRWMIDEATSCGLHFRPKMLAQIKPDHLGALHDSFKGIFKAMPSQPRGLPQFAPGSPDFHPSALERHEAPPITQAPYHTSRTLPNPGDSYVATIFSGEPWNATGLYLEAGVEYEFSAEGEWLDRKIVCGPAGTKDGKFQPAEIAHMVGSFIGKLEGVFQKVSGNTRADFKFTRRVENTPWFALVGVIANGEDPKADGTVGEHQKLLIGAGPLRQKPRRSGYLYAFANDAWHFYDNNRGSVALTVTRISP